MKKKKIEENAKVENNLSEQNPNIEEKQQLKFYNNDSESSMLHVCNDDDYEDVFSNLNDSNLLLIDNKKTLDDKVISKKMKDSYFSRINAL